MPIDGRTLATSGLQGQRWVENGATVSQHLQQRAPSHCGKQGLQQCHAAVPSDGTMDGIIGQHNYKSMMAPNESASASRLPLRVIPSALWGTKCSMENLRLAGQASGSQGGDGPGDLVC